MNCKPDTAPTTTGTKNPDLLTQRLVFDVDNNPQLLRALRARMNALGFTQCDDRPEPRSLISYVRNDGEKRFEVGEFPALHWARRSWGPRYRPTTLNELPEPANPPLLQQDLIFDVEGNPTLAVAIRERLGAWGIKPLGDSKGEPLESTKSLVSTPDWCGYSEGRQSEWWADHRLTTFDELPIPNLDWGNQNLVFDVEDNPDLAERILDRLDALGADTRIARRYARTHQRTGSHAWAKPLAILVSAARHVEYAIHYDAESWSNPTSYRSSVRRLTVLEELPEPAPEPVTKLDPSVLGTEWLVFDVKGDPDLAERIRDRLCALGATTIGNADEQPSAKVKTVLVNPKNQVSFGTIIAAGEWTKPNSIGLHRLVTFEELPEPELKPESTYVVIAKTILDTAVGSPTLEAAQRRAEEVARTLLLDEQDEISLHIARVEATLTADTDTQTWSAPRNWPVTDKGY